MKTMNLPILTAALLLAGTSLASDQTPVELSAAQLDSITAGVGANNVAVKPWARLFANGFVPTHNVAAEAGAEHSGSLDGVAVPRKAPNGVPAGHPGCPITNCWTPPGRL